MTFKKDIASDKKHPSKNTRSYKTDWKESRAIKNTQAKTLAPTVLRRR